jgi:glyoxylase I family protein
MTRRPQSGYSHVTITVTDVAASAAWYSRALALDHVLDSEGPTWRRTVLASPSGFRIGLTTHTATAGADRFDETRVGLDHVAVACADAAEVAAWAEHFDDLGIVRGDVVDAGYATVLVVRDPDGIPIEFFAATAT